MGEVSHQACRRSRFKPRYLLQPPRYGLFQGGFLCFWPVFVLRYFPSTKRSSSESGALLVWGPRADAVPCTTPTDHTGVKSVSYSCAVFLAGPANVNCFIQNRKTPVGKKQKRRSPSAQALSLLPDPFHKHLWLCSYKEEVWNKKSAKLHRYNRLLHFRVKELCCYFLEHDVLLTR